MTTQNSTTEVSFRKMTINEEEIILNEEKIAEEITKDLYSFLKNNNIEAKRLSSICIEIYTPRHMGIYLNLKDNCFKMHNNIKDCYFDVCALFSVSLCEDYHKSILNFIRNK